ncbi:MAG: transcriptional regulator [Bradyrhizobium sp.]|nr:transcriptional regulator [Bradyrhizobium sp.]
MRIGIAVYDNVDMLDVAGPFEMFDWAGFDVEIVAAEAGQIQFRSRGFPFVVTRTFADAGAYDAVWVPGGDPAMLATIIADPTRTYLDFLVHQSRTAKYMCSVCEGAMLLAASGLLDGYEATTHWAFLNCFPQMFPKVLVADGHPRYVLDRDRLTGGGISSGLDEALMLITLLAGREVAQDVQQNTQYYPHPPVESAIPDTPARCPMPSLLSGV